MCKKVIKNTGKTVFIKPELLSRLKLNANEKGLKLDYYVDSVIEKGLRADEGRTDNDIARLTYG